MEEIWKDIQGFEGHYQVSNLGKVKSLSRVIIRSNGKKHSVKEKILSVRPCSKGYSRVVLNNEKTKVDSKVHRLVAIAFLANPNKRSEINHKNGIKSDNSVSNLEWSTRSENVKHAFDNKLKKPQSGILNGQAKLTENEVLSIRSESNKLNQYQLAKKYNVSRSCIASILSGRTWSN